ncbi:MAG: hypothetical protein M5U28_19545 [Sandaracinaceae bacterium]|nr:hypothetical protein [Sandaracinaceae bacterium]
MSPRCSRRGSSVMQRCSRGEPPTSAMEVVLSGGRSVRLGADFDAAALSRLVTTLESMPC